MDAGRQVVLATADQEAVARQFERYDLKSAPVVDADKRLVGVVTVDDVVEVIEEEADEDLRRLAGVGDESITDSVREMVPPASRGCSSIWVRRCSPPRSSSSSTQPSSRWWRSPC